MKRAAPLLSLALLLWVRLVAAAEPPLATMRLDYKRDAAAEPACPDEQEFRDAVAAQVHRPLFDPAAAQRLVVRLQGKGGWYQGVAELRDAAGAPAWTLPLGPVPRDCAALADSLALSVAVKLDPRGAHPAAPVLAPNPHRPFGVDGEVLPMPEMPPPPGPPPGSGRDGVEPPKPTPEPEHRIRLGVTGGVALATGPGWAPSLAFDAGVRWRHLPLSVAVEAGVVPPAGGEVTSGMHTLDITTYRITGAGIACGHFVRFLFACGVVAAGAVHATASAMALKAQPATLFYSGAGGRAGAELPLHAHVAVRLAADALVTLGRPTFEVSGAPVYRWSPVTGTAGGGLVFTF